MLCVKTPAYDLLKVTRPKEKNSKECLYCINISWVDFLEIRTTCEFEIKTGGREPWGLIPSIQLHTTHPCDVFVDPFKVPASVI